MGAARIQGEIAAGRQRARRNDIGSRDELFTALSVVFRVLWRYVLSVAVKSTNVRLSPYFQLLLQVSLPCGTIFTAILSVS